MVDCCNADAAVVCNPPFLFRKCYICIRCKLIGARKDYIIKADAIKIFSIIIY